MSPPVKEKRLTGILHKPQKRLLIGTLTVIAVACLIVLPVIALTQIALFAIEYAAILISPQTRSKLAPPKDDV